MGITAFDTPQFVKSLRSAGFDEAQAEALSFALRDAHESFLDNLVTKSDFREFRYTVEAKIESLEKRFDALEARQEAIENRMAGVENRITSVEARLAKVEADVKVLKWMTGFIVGGILVLILQNFFLP